MWAGVLAKNICSLVRQSYSCAGIQKCQEYPYMIFLGWIIVPTLLLTLWLLQNVFVEISWEEKNKAESKLLAGLSTEPESFLSQLGWAVIFQLKEKFWIFAGGRHLSRDSMNDCITKLIPMRHSRGGDPFETPVPWVKRLVRHMADRVVQRPSHSLQSSVLLEFSIHSWSRSSAPGTRKSWKPTHFPV